MSDIVERLREQAELVPVVPRAPWKAMAEAADEITRLRAQVAALEADMVMVPRDLLRRLIAEALTFDPNLQDKGAITQAKQLAAAAELARAGAQKGE